LQVFLHIKSSTDILIITVSILLFRHYADNAYSQLLSVLSWSLLTHIRSFCGCWINWGRGFHCLLSVIRFRRLHMLFQKVTMKNHPSSRQITFSIYWDSSPISGSPVMYRLVPKLRTTEHSAIPPRRFSKEQAIADSNSPASACPPAFTPLLKLGMLQYFYLVF